MVKQRPSVVPKLTDSVANVGALPTASVETINAQNRLNAYSTDMQVQYPKLTEQIQSLEQGAKKPSGALGTIAHLFDNPIAKAVLAPLLVLDTGRRAVISGVREVADVLDSDKNTKASLTDWFKQTKDTTYGFGTAFPMKGAAGRIVGFLGDVLLDPITYATLGTAIPAKAAIKGGTVASGLGRAAVREGAEELIQAGATGLTRQAAEQVAEYNLRQVLGRKSVATAEGRAAMAGLAGRMGGSNDLVKAIGAEGRRAFRTTQEGVEMAQRLGLNRSGIYYFGSRVRVPFTGPIADFIETGLVKSRLGIMKSAPGEWISKNFTTAGTSSARDLRQLKAGLAKGTLTPERSKFAAELLTHEAASRAQGAIAKDTFAKLVKYHLGSNAARTELFDADVLQNASSIYKYLDIDPENWAAAGLPQMTPSQESAYRKIQNMFREFHTNVEGQFKTIDPNFTLNKIKDYFPHMMTEDGYRYVGNNSSPYAEQIRQYLKMNMTDPSASFKHRGLVEGAPWFGKPLTKEDVAGGIDKLNQLAREAGFKGNFFETDITKVLSRYGEHYAEQFATAEFMRRSMDSGILRMAKEMEVVDEDWVRGTVGNMKNANEAFRTSSSALVDAGSSAVEVANTLLKDIKDSLRGQAKELKAATREAGTPEQRLAQLTAAETKLGLAEQAVRQRFDEFKATLSEQSELVAALESQLDETLEAIRQTQVDLAEFAKTYSASRLRAVDPRTGDFVKTSLVEDLIIGQDVGSAKLMYKGEVRTLDEIEKSLDRAVQRSAASLQKMQDNWDRTTLLHDQINDILNRYLNGKFEDVVDNITGETIEGESLRRMGVGSESIDEILDVLMFAGVRDVRSAPSTKVLDRNWVGRVWNNKADPEMTALRQVIDPNGQLNLSNISKIRMEDYYPSVEQAVRGIDRQIAKVEKELTTLSAIPKRELDVKQANRIGEATKIRQKLIAERDATIARRGKPGEVMVPGIRTRIARGLTIGDNMLELREAAVWLILRDVKINVSDIATGAAKAGDSVTEYVSQNFGRYKALVNSLRRADSIQGIFRNKGLVEAQKELRNAKSRLMWVRAEFDVLLDEEITPEIEANYFKNFDEAAEKVEELEKKVASFSRKLTKQNEELLNRIGDTSNFREAVQELAANTSEYYLHRETVIQFRRLATSLDYVGLKPTQAMYNRILASVAESEFRNMKEFSSRLSEFQDLLKRLRDGVRASGYNASDEQIAFQEQLRQIFDPFAWMSKDNPQYANAVSKLDDLKGQLARVQESIPQLEQDAVSGAKQQVKDLEKAIKEAEQTVKSLPKEIVASRDAELIREFMPEIEAVFLYDRLDTVARQFYRDPQGQALMGDIQVELRRLGLSVGEGRPVSRKARVVTGGEAKPTAAPISYRRESEVERLARYDASTKNFEESMRLLKEEYAKRTKQVTSGVTLEYDQPLVQTIGESLSELDLRQFGVENVQRLDDYRSRYNAIIKRIKADTADAQKRAQRSTGASSVKVQRQKIREAIKNPEEFGFGFSAELSNALNFGGVAMDDFFATLIGGTKLRRGTAEYSKRVAKGKLLAGVRKAEFETIDETSSYFGKLHKTTMDRIFALRYLMDDPDIPTNVLLEGDRAAIGMEPSGWVLAKNLRGQQAYADALEEHADALLTVLERDRTIAKNLKKKQTALARTEREYDKLIGGPGMRVQTKRTKRLEQIELKNARAEERIAKLKGSIEHVRAETMEREHTFAKNLAHYNREDVNYMLRQGLNTDEFDFTVDEWDALWSENLPEESLQSLRGRKGALTRELSNLPKDNAETRFQSALNPKVRAKMERVQQIRDQIAVVDSMIAKYDARSSAMGKFGRVEKVFAKREFQDMFQMDMSKKPTMSSAEALFAIGNSRYMTEYFKEMNIKFPPRKQIDARKVFLDSAWKSSDEYKHLSAVKSLMDEMNWYSHELFVSSRDRLLARHKELRDEISKLRGNKEANIEKVATLESQISSLLGKTEPVYGAVPKAKQGKDLAARQAKTRAARIREPEQVERVAKEYVEVDQAAIDAGITPTQQQLIAKQKEFEEVARMLENIQFAKIVDMNLQPMALDYISTLNAKQKALLKQKMNLAESLAKEQGILEDMYAGTPKLLNAEDRMRMASEGVRVAQVRYDNAQTFAQYGAEEAKRIETDLSDLGKIAERGRIVKGQVKRGTDAWTDDTLQLLEDSIDLWRRVNGDEIPNEVRAVATSLIDARNEFVKQTFNKTDAEVERALAKGIQEMAKNGIPVDGAGVRLAGGQTKMVKVFDDGFVQLSKYFPDIGVREEVAEIYQNVHRLQQPLLAREMSKFLSKYTTFFKAYATLSPGFHVRNSLSNGFMLVAAGSDPRRLAEGLKWSRSWIEASKAGTTFDEWILSIPTSARQKVSDAFKAAAASGGGMTDEMIQNTVPFGTKGSRKLGRWIEQHSRFMLAYDGAASGMDMTTSAARVKRFLIDYQDISTADAYMRQIIPFWMWTSRNLPMQLQNMWANPRAYAIYNSLKRNIEEKDADKPVPLWMRELGAFKLPGTNFYATPDLGFNRIGQQIEELRDPRRALANVTPILRLPIELTGGRQLYSGREFSDVPVQVEDGAGALLQPLLALAGYGETTAEGKKFVNDRAYYALRNLVPFLGTAERLTPSIQTYQQRGYVNPLLGFLGVPTRQLTEQDMQGELARRKREIQKIVSKEKAMEGNE